MLLRRGRLATLALGLATLFGASLTASAADAADDTARGVLPAPATTRIGTFNINASQTLEVWTKAISDFMPMVDVAGLQEVNSKPKTVWLLGVEGWGSYRPSELRQNPIIWDESVFELVDGRGEKIADARAVEVPRPGADSFKQDSYATVVRLRHLGTGQTVSVVNVHLATGAVNGGKRIAGRPKLYGLYVDQVAGVRDVVAAEQAWAGGDVYVLGDFNNNYPADRRFKRAPLAYAQLTGAGLVSAWETRPVLMPGQGSGTRSGSYLDNVWAGARALSISVKRTFRVSDHYPVVTTYSVLPPVPGIAANRAPTTR